MGLLSHEHTESFSLTHVLRTILSISTHTMTLDAVSILFVFLLVYLATAL